MAYDTTLLETTDPAIPNCLRRDRLRNPYFPAIGGGRLAIVGVLCLAFLWTSFHRLHHTDLWGHLAFGRWIVEHAALPSADPFSAQAGNRFFNAPWLAQVAGYLTHAGLGVEGLVFGHALLVTLAAGLVMLGARGRGTGEGVAACAGAAAVFLSLPILGVIRPQLFGMVGIPLTLLAINTALRGAEAGNRAWRGWLLGLPAAYALWANLHGSFVIGLFLLGLALLGALWDACRRTGSLPGSLHDIPFRSLSWFTLLALLGSFATPFGPGLLLKVAGFGSTAALEHISEWRRLTPASLSGALFGMSLLLSALLAWKARRRPTAVELVVFLGFGLLTVTGMRMLVWWAFVWPWLMAPYAQAAWNRRRGEEHGDLETAQATPMRTLLAMTFVFLTLIISPATRTLATGQGRGPVAALSSGTPIFLAEELRRRGAEGPLFAPMEWADYLLYDTGGAIRPLIFSHVHLVEPAVWHDYLRLASGAEDWHAIARRHELRYLAAGRENTPQLARLLAAEARQAKPRVRMLYQDQQGILVELLGE